MPLRGSTDSHGCFSSASIRANPCLSALRLVAEDLDKTAQPREMHFRPYWQKCPTAFHAVFTAMKVRGVPKERSRPLAKLLSLSKSE
ncbi:hypothetical protein MSR1_19110 [Magnetospirillum gryphiswaldense MSR-1]|nr:hypothetical protein MSR1_19110 [Magnetospirillum gryphiswaldense MSR-1]AVM78303.1 hypothetical protein MSR1L_19110 [Magnetospirillum gryphiswaldense]